MNEEARTHLEKARERLEDAKAMLARDRHAGCVNRTYYAMFEAASALLADYGLSFGSHDAVITKFSEMFAKTGKVDRKFGRHLSRAYGLRKDADYAIDSRAEIAPEVAEGEFRKATEFVAMAERFLEGVGGDIEE